LIIDTTTDTAIRSNLGANLTDYYKWMGGVLGNDGKIYAIPNNSTDILVINPLTQTADRTTINSTSLLGTDKWVGGILSTDGKIYCIPYDAQNILIIDTNNNKLEITNFGTSITGLNKWSGAVLDLKGDIYCSHFDASDILKINENYVNNPLPIKRCVSGYYNKY
jgi:hypothetical protein